MRQLLIAIAISALTACTVVTVRPINRASYNLQKVCIEQNEAVKQSGFLPMLEKAFEDHGIPAEHYKGRPSDSCEFTVTYVAHWNWDVAYYMTDAEIVVRRGGEEVGRAVYHLRNKGGLDMGKWAGTESKMVPVMDKMLADFAAGKVANPEPVKLTQEQIDKATKCQEKNGVWVNDQCVIHVE